jgi:acylpyruvate hydrolase
MKFTTYLRDGAPRLAVVDGNDLIDLNRQPHVPADLRARR